MQEGTRNSLRGCGESRIHGSSSGDSSIVILCSATKLLFYFTWRLMVQLEAGWGRGRVLASYAASLRNMEMASHIFGKRICLHIIPCARISFTIRNIQFVWLWTPFNLNTIVPVREIIVYSENHTKHVNMMCGQSEEFHNFKAGSKNSNHTALKGDYPLLIQHLFTTDRAHPLCTIRHL